MSQCLKGLLKTTNVFLTIGLLFISGCKKEPEKDVAIISQSGKPTSAIVSSGNLWYDKFVTYESANGGNYYQSSSSNTLGWSESYMLRSYVELYKLTKNTSWLDKFVTHANYMVNVTAADTDGDGYKDFKHDPANEPGTTKYPYIVHEGLIGLALAQFTYLVNENASTLSAYSTAASNYLSYIETHIYPKWNSSGSYINTNCYVVASATESYYKEPTFSSGGDSLPGHNFTPLPYNMILGFVEMLYVLHDITGNSTYLDRANKCTQYWENRLGANGNGYQWYYWNTLNTTYRRIEDTSHGNIDIETMVEAFNRGQIFTGSQFITFLNTLTTHMWNGSTSAPKVAARVDGSSVDYTDPWANTLLLTGWTALAQANRLPWIIAANQFRSITPTSFNHAFTLVQLMKWDPVKVANNGFEYYVTDNTLPSRWTRGSGSTTTSVKLDAVNKFSGKYGAAITSSLNDGVWQMLYQDWEEWVPGASYTVTFNVKTSGAAGARIFMYNVTTGAVIGSVHDYDSSSWSTQSFTFTAPSTAGPTLRIYLENHDLNTAGTAYFDNVIIKRTGDAW